MDLASTQLGKALRPSERDGPRHRKYLRNANVRWDGFDLSDLATMHFSEEESRRYSLEPGDLLVCEGGEVGRCAIWGGQVDNCHFQKAIHRVRPHAGLDQGVTAR